MPKGSCSGCAMGIAYAWFVPTSAPSLGPISVADKPLVGEGDTGAMFPFAQLEPVVSKESRRSAWKF